MERQISLYIGSNPRKADLGDDNFLLFNWSNGELTEPAQIKNSWSRQITLPGTSLNDAIFGEMWRHDRETAFSTIETSVYFDPSRRTPFQLFDEAGAFIESGYLKLDEITQEGPTHSYKVTLFGGLGGFLFSLTYDAQGNKRTLADLIYKDHNGNVQDLDFNISKTTVKAAWDFLSSHTSPHYLQNNKWDFINFAPCYNGFPKGVFSPNKAVVDTALTGIPASVDGYTPMGGGSVVLASFSESLTEWETRDLRSYLQRPVVRLGAILEAIADPDNNGGYTVDLDETIFDPVLSDNKYVWGTWLTLPILANMEIHQDAGSEVSFAVSSGSNTIPTVYGAAASFRIQVAPKIAAASAARYLYAKATGYVINWIELVATFYDTNNVAVRQQTIRFGSVIDDAYQSTVQISNLGHFDASGNWTGSPAVFEWSNIAGSGNETYSRVVLSFSNGSEIVEGQGSGLAGYVWTDPTNPLTNVAYTNSPQCSGTFNADAVEAVRSYTDVKASDLLRGSATPAEYLLSFCKMMGLRLIFDPVANKVTVTDRKHYYQWGGTATDISARINRGKPITTTPLTFDKRWYRFAQDYSQGEWAKYYASTYGRTYGEQRIDTGYDFDAGTYDVIPDLVFKGAVQILENSKYFCRGLYNSRAVPGVFFDNGATYQMYNSAGESKDFNLPRPTDIYDYSNRSGYPYFDVNDKPQFHNENNAYYDSRDALLFFRGMETDVYEEDYRDYRLTDDTAIMMTLNNNTPCWDLTDGLNLAEIPHFSRYSTTLDGAYLFSLDFGTPSEIPVPGIGFNDWATIYKRSWQSFIGDRLDVDTRVVRCWVDLSGLNVGQDLLRGFYYFDGAIWSLNKIINYSLTTWDDTECEFVKVQDPNNY